MSDDPTKTEVEWRNKLTPKQYQVMRNKGTEHAFSGEYWDSKDIGVYVCACLLYTSTSPRDAKLSRMPSSA